MSNNRTSFWPLKVNEYAAFVTQVRCLRCAIDYSTWMSYEQDLLKRLLKCYKWAFSPKVCLKKCCKLTFCRKSNNRTIMSFKRYKFHFFKISNGRTRAF